MAHIKSALVTVVSAKTKYYEKLIISANNLMQSELMWLMWNVRDWPFVKFDVAFILLIIVLIKISVFRIRAKYQL